MDKQRQEATEPKTTANPVAEELRSGSGEVMALRYDVTQILQERVGADWQHRLEKVVQELGKEVVRDASHPTCRESDPNALFSLIVVDGDALAHAVPEMLTLYSGEFSDFMHESLPPDVEEMTEYVDFAEASMEAVLQPPQQEGSGVHSRMEAHVDQRYTAILCVKAPEDEDTGRLIIASEPNTRGFENIQQNGTYVTHKEGTLVCFPMGRFYPHATEPMQGDDTRLVISINYPVVYETPQETTAIMEHSKGMNGYGTGAKQ